MKDTHPHSQEQNDRCPVTGWPVLRKPEWSGVGFGGSYRATFSLIGERVLLVETSGKVTLQELEHALELDTRIKETWLPNLQPYVRIEHWKKLQGTSREGRDLYIQYIKSDRRLRGLIFWGLPTLFKMAVKIGLRVNTFNFKLEVVESYDQAMRLAKTILGGSEDVSVPVNYPKPADEEAGNPLKEPSSQSVTHDHWQYQTGSYSIRFEVINGNILHVITSGTLREGDVSESFRIKEQVALAMKVVEDDYYCIIGLSDSHGASPTARKNYISALIEYYRKFPFRIIIFYGANKLLRAAINLSKPFVPFEIGVAQDFKEALALVEISPSFKQPGALQEDMDPPVLETSPPEEVRPYVLDLLKFLDGINWTSDAVRTDVVRDPGHPLAPVFDAIELLKWEFDDLLREQQLIQTDLRQAKEMEEKANRAKSEFLANMSHELRTPLNHVIGFTEMIVDRAVGPLNVTQEEYLNDVLGSSQHLLSLINDILDLSKVEAGKMNLEASDIPLEKVLRDSLNIVKEEALKHFIAITFHFQEIPTTIRADERRLKQILYNLLSNAVKFTPAGGTVVLEARGLEGQGVEIKVSDTGIGLPTADLERIFHPFEQGDNSTSRKYQGTGLGLSLTKHLIELHNGKIWAESPGPGEGATFRFILPAVSRKGEAE